MAALDFPLVPNTESEVTTGDITWKWNGYAWYAASQGDDVYLSKVTDDEAAGAITFKVEPTFELGAYFGTEGQSRLDAAGNVFRFMTGDVPGGSWTPITIARNHNSSKALTVKNTSPEDGSDNVYYGGISTSVGIEGISVRGGNTNSNNIPAGYTSSLTFDGDSSCTTYAHYNITSTKNGDNSGTGAAPEKLAGYLCHSSAFGMNDGTANTAFADSSIIAFSTNLNSDTASAQEVYAIKCDGDAPSSFGGLTEHVAGVRVLAGDRNKIEEGMRYNANYGIELISDSQTAFVCGYDLSNTVAIISGESKGGVGSGDIDVKRGLYLTPKFKGNPKMAVGLMNDCDISDVAVGTYYFYSASVSKGDPNPDKAFGESYCYSAPLATAKGRNKAYAFYTDYAEDGNKVYGFYAAGGAPNYFGGLTDHAAGVRVTGGTAASVENGLWRNNRGLSLGSKTSGDDVYGASVSHIGDGNDCAIASSLAIKKGGGNGSNRPDYRGIYVTREVTTTNAGNTAYGIYSDIVISPTGTNYNFYAAGGAPNYFAGGVQFDIAAGTSALSDYEEGTWTPAFSGEDGTVTYTMQAGTYVKVGNHITVHFEIDYSGASGSNAMAITAPFKGTNATTSGFAATGSVTIYAATGSSDMDKPLSSTISRNSTSIGIRTAGVMSGNPGQTSIKYDNTPAGRLKGTITYRTV